MRPARLPGIALACALIGPAPSAHPQGPGPQPGRRYALLVGVRQYDPNELRSLPYSEPDVVELAEVLKAAGYRQVVTLTQTAGNSNFRLSPTAANIRTTLKGMLRDRGPGDTVVVAFAGHGVQFRGSAESYFCPMDARLADRRTLVPLGEVYKDLQACAAGVKVLLVDACRNDPQSDNSRSRATVRLESVTRPQQARPPGGVAALFSCSEGERAFEHERLKHGVFYHFVIRGLKGEADLDKDGAVGVEELALYTKGNVPDFVKEEYGFDVRQMPVLRGEVGGLAALVGLRGAKGPEPATARTSKPAGAGTELGSRLPERRSPRPSPTKAAEEITNSIGMRLARIPAGTFRMGATPEEIEEALRSDKDARRSWFAAEVPPHEVRISRPFYLGVTEVTQAQYRAVVASNPSKFSPTGAGRDQVAGLDTDDFPVETVSWEDAVAFCRRLSGRAEERRAGRVYRLPTEAEWEYACRGGSGEIGPFFFRRPSRTLSADRANFDGSAPFGEAPEGPFLERPTAVGSFEPNAWGLHDLHGNVQEWCADWFDPGYYANSPREDPRGPDASPVAGRVARGGHFLYPGRSCRAASRFWKEPASGSGHYGFRIAMTAERGKASP